MNLSKNMDYKQEIDKYFSTRTPELKKYYFKFCLPNERNHWGEMLSELYMHIISNVEKVKDWVIKDELHYYCIKFIYNQRNWSKTSFKKTINIPDSIILDSINEFQYLGNEQTNLDDIYEKEININLKLELLHNALTYLDYYERYVYSKYFVEKKTLRGIASEVGLSHIAIHRIVHKIKNKLQNIIQKQR